MENLIATEAINQLIYFMPYMFAFAVFYLFISLRGGRKNIYKANVFAIIVMGIMLTVFYLPHSDILRPYQFKDIEVRIGNGPSVRVTDQEKVNHIVNEINRHKFMKSAFKTVRPQNFAEENLIWLGFYDTAGKGVQHLYLERNSIDCTLRVSGQDFNVWDKKELIENIESELRD